MVFVLIGSFALFTPRAQPLSIDDGIHQGVPVSTAGSAAPTPTPPALSSIESTTTSSGVASYFAPDGAKAPHLASESDCTPVERAGPSWVRCQVANFAQDVWVVTDDLPNINLAVLRDIRALPTPPVIHDAFVPALPVGAAPVEQSAPVVPIPTVPADKIQVPVYVPTAYANNSAIVPENGAPTCVDTTPDDDWGCGGGSSGSWYDPPKNEPTEMASGN